MQKKHDLATITSIGISTLLLLLLVSPASAIVVLRTIDDFDAGTFSLSFPDGGSDTGILTHELDPSPQVFGERRNVSWDVTANPASREASASVVSGSGLSVLFVSTESGVEATTDIEYGSAGGTILGNLEDDGADSFMVVFASLNQTLDVVFRVTDDAGSTYSNTMRVDSSGEHFIPFDSFSGFDLGDFSNVPLLEVSFQSPTNAPDYLVDGIFTSRSEPVPEPSVTLLGGLAMAFGLRRRRQLQA